MLKYKTSEWVSLGHPDKVADYISEYILDRLIEQDPETRYALEVQIKGSHVSLAGEITTKAYASIDAFKRWTREAIQEIGYTKAYQEKFGAENTICNEYVNVTSNISRQSPDIAQGVNASGWGDQGIFFGFYCDESDEGHGYDYYLAKIIGQALYNKALTSDTLGLDIKTQVTVFDNVATRNIEEIIVAIPMVAGKEKEGKKEVKGVIKEILKDERIPTIINGTGTYCQHGPIADSGTTGRKLVVDFYGGNSRIGGGSPWTKDGTKADLTLNLYANEKARENFLQSQEMGIQIQRVETEISCVIGKAQILIVTNGYDDDGVIVYSDAVIKTIQPKTLIKKYGLNKPIYAQLCRDGLFSIFKTKTKGKTNA